MSERVLHAWQRGTLYTMCGKPCTSADPHRFARRREDVSCEECAAIAAARHGAALRLASEAAHRASASWESQAAREVEANRWGEIENVAPSHMEWMIESFGESLSARDAVILAARVTGRSWAEIGRWAGVSKTTAQMRARSAFLRMAKLAAVAGAWPRPRMALVEER